MWTRKSLILILKIEIMTREIKITPPEGFEIDRENSTLDCIKFKPVAKRWRDTNPFVKGYCVDGNDIVKYDVYNRFDKGNHDMYATEKQAKSALAMAQISQIMANDLRFGGVVTDEEWKNCGMGKYCINRFAGKLRCDLYDTTHHFLAFHTREQCDLFLKENEDLVKDYLML